MSSNPHPPLPPPDVSTVVTQRPIATGYHPDMRLLAGQFMPALLVTQRVNGTPTAQTVFSQQ